MCAGVVSEQYNWLQRITQHHDCHP